MVMENLTALGFGIITFAIVIGVGLVVVYKMSAAMTNCSDITATDYYNATSVKCHNATGTVLGDPGSATANMNYMATQMGTTGLAGWTPAIIALVVGMLFLGMFMAKGGRSV